jgi:hypothetical protein
MKTRRIAHLLVIFCAAFWMGAGVDGASAEEGNAGEASREKGLQQRIDFGSAYILGQSIKSGAVYLLHRKQSDIKGMIEVRQDYREEIKEDYALEKTALVAEETEIAPEQEKKPGPRIADGSMDAKPQQSRAR